MSKTDHLDNTIPMFSKGLAIFLDIFRKLKYTKKKQPIDKQNNTKHVIKSKD